MVVPPLPPSRHRRLVCNFFGMLSRVLNYSYHRVYRLIRLSKGLIGTRTYRHESHGRGRGFHVGYCSYFQCSELGRCIWQDSAQEFLIWETLPSPDSISPRDAWHRAALVFPLSNSATVVGHNP